MKDTLTGSVAGDVMLLIIVVLLLALLIGLALPRHLLS
jgi:hypothetical protein